MTNFAVGLFHGTSLGAGSGGYTQERRFYHALS